MPENNPDSFNKIQENLENISISILLKIKEKDTESAFIETSKYEIELGKLMLLNGWKVAQLFKNGLYYLSQNRVKITKIEFLKTKNDKNAANYSFYYLNYFIDKHFFNLVKTPPNFYSFLNEKRNFEEKKIMYFEKEFCESLKILNINIELLKQQTFDYLFMELPKIIGYSDVVKTANLISTENFKENRAKRHEIYEFTDKIKLEPLRMNILENINKILEECI